MAQQAADLPDFIATYWTHAGDVVVLGPPDQEASPHDFRLRAEAASAAGFRGIGLIHSDLIRARRQYSFAEMKSILDDNGLAQIEFEFLVDWLEDGAALEASAGVYADLLEAAEALDARHIKVGPDMAGRNWPLAHMAERFSALCARADGVGTAIVLEIMPWSNIKRIDAGVALIEAANCANGGLLIDIWHVARGDIDYAEVAAIPKGLIHHVELNDAAGEVVGSLFEDTTNRRMHCGRGDFDVPKFIQALDEQGYDGPVGIELLSEVERRRPFEDVLRDAYDCAAAQYVVART